MESSRRLIGLGIFIGIGAMRTLAEASEGLSRDTIEAITTFLREEECREYLGYLGEMSKI